MSIKNKINAKIYHLAPESLLSSFILCTKYITCVYCETSKYQTLAEILSTIPRVRFVVDETKCILYVD